MDALTIEKRIYNMMKEIKVFGNVYEKFPNMYAVEIIWGDWKHDHLRLDHYMTEYFPEAVHILNKTTEENGSDNYSAIHYFYFG